MNPVQSLQHLLNQIALSVPSIPRVMESGVFDEPTLEAVMIFQRDYHLPVTGVVDQATWNAIVRVYYEQLMKYGVPSLLSVLPFGTSSFGEGNHNAQILMTQAMLKAIAEKTSNFLSCPIDGVNSGSTLDNLRQLQSLSGLPQTGTLDRATWAMLARLYRAIITRSPMDRPDSHL